MKNKATILAVLALVGVSFVLTGCPHRHHRPHVPHPHHLVPANSLIQINEQNNAETSSMLVAGNPRLPE